MTDITMCRDTVCRLAGDCYRFMAKPSLRQSYFMESPREEGEDKCKYFWMNAALKAIDPPRGIVKEG